MLAEKAAKMKYVKWATIGPNYEYGKRAWETFRDRLKELKPDVQVVNEQWPTLGKIEPGPMVTAILNKNPDALRLALRRDWLAFVREARSAPLPEDFVVGILLGARVHRPSKLERPRHALDGLSLVATITPPATRMGGPLHHKTRQDPGTRLAHRLYHDRLDRGRHQKAGATETDKLVAAFKNLKVEDTDRAHYLPAPPTASPHVRLGGHHEARPHGAAPAS